MGMARAAVQSSREAARNALANMAPSAHLRNSKNKAEIFLLGVSHVSQASASRVQQLIRIARPDVVAVELCDTRSQSAILTGEVHEKYAWSEFFQIPGSFKQKLFTFGITNMYAAMAAKGIRPGAEMTRAVEEGRALGAKIAFVDLEQDVSFEKASQHLSFKLILDIIRKRKEIEAKYRKTLIALGYAFKGKLDLFSLDDVTADVLRMGTEYFPDLLSALCDERNEHMVKELRKMEGSIVGVVGALHVSGMQKLWQEAEQKCSRR